MRRFLQNNGLSIALLVAFLVIWLGGQTSAGLREYNAERSQDGQSELSFGQYLRSAHFGEATFENWESEFLQMGMYVLLTVRLRQRGSAESKSFDRTPQDETPPHIATTRMHRGRCAKAEPGLRSTSAR